MDIKESDLSKGEIRKLNALKRSIGDKLAEEVFPKWLKQKQSKATETALDPVADMIYEAVKPLARKKDLNLGRYGYVIKRARGKGAKGLVVSRIERS